MKKQMRWINILVIVIMLVFAVNVQSVHAASNPYPATQDVDGDGRYEIPCTRFAWQQVYDSFGVALPAWGNAVNWWQSAINAGYATGSEPKAGAIAVWSGDTYGHVAYVTSGSGNTFVVNEGGRTDLDHTDSHGVAYGYKITNAVGGYRPYDSNKKLLGFIYPTNSGSTQKPWVEIRDVTEVTATEAKLNGYIRNPGGVYITTVGVYVWDGNGNLIKEHYEEINSQSHTRDGVDMWFYLNADLGLNRQSLPKFKYQLFAISNLGTVYTGAVEYSTSWHATLKPVDIGTEIYAWIIKDEGWAHLGNVKGNMEVTGNTDAKDASDMWRFVKQGDGSYAIFSCLDDKVLTALSSGQTNGTNVMLAPWGGTDNQKWYIYGRWSGEYVLRPKYTDKVLDVNNGGNTVGTNAYLWTYSAGNKAQMFAIYVAPAVGNSEFSVKEGNSAIDTKFSWTTASKATGYVLKIQKGSKDNVTVYKEIPLGNETSYNIVLPEGYYEACVISSNRYSRKESNKVTFTIEKNDIPIAKKMKFKCNEDESCTVTWELIDYNPAYKVQLIAKGESSEEVVYNITSSGKGSYTIPISVFDSLGKRKYYWAMIRVIDSNNNVVNQIINTGIAHYSRIITVVLNSEGEDVTFPKRAVIGGEAFYDDTIISIIDNPDSEIEEDLRIVGLKKGFTNIWWRDNKTGDLIENVGVKVVELPASNISGVDAAGQKNTSIDVKSIHIDGISDKIAAGKKIKLTAVVSSSNATNKAVKWKSSNTKVAKVNSSGIVTMNKKSGGKSVTITATAVDGSGVKASYKITSMKGVVKKVAISGKKTVKAGKTLKLKAKVTATQKANKKLKWTSSNKKYATVSSSGKVKALKAGKGKKVKITAMATDGSGKKKAVTIKIK